MSSLFKKKSTYLLLIITILAGAGYYYFKHVSRWVDLLYTPNKPVAVANDFWLTVLSKDEKNANQFVMRPEAFSELIKGHSEADRFILTTVEQDSNVYFIKTQIVVNRKGLRSFPLFTVVRSSNGEFKVDVSATLVSLPDALQESVFQYYESSTLNAKAVLSDEYSSSGNISAFSEQQIKITLCSMAEDLTNNFTGQSSVIFEECRE
jgi:hypothetical protein